MSSLEEQLKALEQARAVGVLTNDEYTSRRAAIIDAWGNEPDVAPSPQPAPLQTTRMLPMDLPMRAGEYITFETRGWFSWLVYGLGCGWMIVTLPVLAIMAIAEGQKHLVVTNQRVIYTHGVLGKSQHVIERSRIQDVRIRQGWGTNSLGYGTLVIESAGRVGPDMITTIRNPREARNAILSER